jgi:hypothetical protein
MKFKINPANSIGQSLRSELLDLLGGINSQVNDGLASLTQQAEAKAKDYASTRLHATRQQYESALNAVQLGPNKWAIVLNADAAQLEEGYASYDMKPGMLNSNAIVQSGKNAGKKWVRTSKDGYKYAIVPMDQSNTGSGAGMNSPDSQVQIQNPVTNGPGGLSRQGGVASGTQTRGDLKRDMNHMIKRAGAAFKNAPSGTRLVGNPGNANEMKMVEPGQSMKDGMSFNLGKSLGGSSIPVNPLLNGLVKKTFEQKQKNGKTVTKSAYMTYRIVSEKQTGKWIHPGFSGAKIFPDLEQWAATALEKMVQEILQNAG